MFFDSGIKKEEKIAANQIDSKVNGIILTRKYFLELTERKTIRM